ncbi:MAG: GspL/Epsl periplasmic domain-containing protein [Leptospirillia bacterium]
MRTVTGMHTYSGADGVPVRRAARLRAGLKGQQLTALGKKAEDGAAGDVALTVSECALREITVPFPDLKKATQVAPFEVEGLVSFDPDDSVVSLEPLASDANGSRLLVAVAPESRVEALIDEGGGEEVTQFLLPEAVALFHFARRVLSGRDGSFLFVDVRSPRILLVAIKDGGWAGSRTLTSGWDPGAVAEPPRDTLMALRRAAQSLYLDADAPPLAVVPLGDGNGPDGELAAEAGAAIGTALNTETMSLFELPGMVEFGRAGAADLSVNAVATGLALAALDGKRHMNLRAGRFALQLGEEQEMVERVMHIGIGVLVVLLIAWGAGFIRYQGAATELAQVKGALASQYKEVFPDDTRVVDPLHQAQNKLKVLQARSLMVGGGGTTVLGYLAAVSEAIPQIISIDVMEFTLEGTRLRMEAEVNSFDAIDQVKAQIATIPGVGEVRVSDAKQSAKENRVKFRVHATLDEGI